MTKVTGLSSKEVDFLSRTQVGDSASASSGGGSIRSWRIHRSLVTPLDSGLLVLLIVIMVVATTDEWLDGLNSYDHTR